MSLKASKGTIETYTALLQPLQRLKLVPSSLASLHSQQTEPATACNGKPTCIPLVENIEPSTEVLVGLQSQGFGQISMFVVTCRNYQWLITRKVALCRFHLSFLQEIIRYIYGRPYAPNVLSAFCPQVPGHHSVSAGNGIRYNHSSIENAVDVHLPKI